MIISPSLKKGLSMVEVMIVLAIMAVFALAVGPRMLSYLGKAKIKTTEVMLRNVKQAITSYYSDTGRYPESLADLSRKPYDETIAKKWHGPYLDSEDEDYVPLDGWSNELIYHRSEPGSSKPYELYSTGEGGDDGSDDERIYA